MTSTAKRLSTLNWGQLSPLISDVRNSFSGVGAGVTVLAVQVYDYERDAGVPRVGALPGSRTTLAGLVERYRNQTAGPNKGAEITRATHKSWVGKERWSLREME